MAYSRKDLTKTDQLARCIRWFRDWDEATAQHRLRAARDRAYYDGLQWTSQQIEEMERDKRPILTDNRIDRKVNFILGTEMQDRTDPQALPRTQLHDEEAEVVTDTLRYLDDKNEFEELTSDVMEELFVDGWSGSIMGVEPDIDAQGILRGYDQTETHVPSDQCWWDPHSKHFSFRDALYTGIHGWWDYEMACVDPRYQEAHEALLGGTMGNVAEVGTLLDDKPTRWFDSSRERLMICEVYYKDFDKERQRVEWFGAHFTGAGFLIEPFRVPFEDEKGRTFNPMNLMSCYVMKQENERKGLVRGYISMQNEINHRRTRAVHLMNQRQTMGEYSAVLDIDEMKEQMAKADGHVELEDGALAEGRFMAIPTQDMVTGNLQMLQSAEAAIDKAGPQQTLLDSSSQAQMSGRAIIARQEMGSMELKPVFDHALRWKKRSYRCRWWLARMYWTYEMHLRVHDDTKGHKFVALNEKTTKGKRLQELVSRRVEIEDAVLHCFGQEEGPMMLQQAQQQVQQYLQQRQLQQQQAVQWAKANGQQAPQGDNQPTPDQMAAAISHVLLQSPQAQQEFIANNVAQLDVDIVLTTTKHSDLVEHEQFESLSAMLSKYPNMQQKPKLIELVVRAGNFRDKKQILAALNEGPSPEQQQMQQQIQQLQLQLQQATVAKTQAQAQKEQAQAQGIMMESQMAPQRAQAEMVKLQLEAQRAQTEAGVAQAQAMAMAVEAQLAPQNLQLEQLKLQGEARRSQAEALHAEAQARLLLAQAATTQSEMLQRGLQTEADVLRSRAEALKALAQAHLVLPADARLKTAQAVRTEVETHLVVPREANLKDAQARQQEAAAKAAGQKKPGPEEAS